MSSNTSTNEHGRLQHTMGKAQDALGGVAGRMSAAMVTSADQFVENAAIGDMYEIAAANVALRRASSPAVRALAKMMHDDHTTSMHHLVAALEMTETLEVASPPTQVDARRQKMLENLEAAPDDKFDSTYVDQQVLAHEETLTLMTSFRDKGDNPQLRSLAAATAPVIERHLRHVKALAKGEVS